MRRRALRLFLRARTSLPRKPRTPARSPRARELSTGGGVAGRGVAGLPPEVDNDLSMLSKSALLEAGHPLRAVPGPGALATASLHLPAQPLPGHRPVAAAAHLTVRRRLGHTPATRRGGGGSSGSEAPAARLPATSLPSPSEAPAALAAAGLVLALALAPPAEALSLQGAVSGLEQVISDAGYLGPALFVAAYVLFTVLLIPGSVLTLAAGFLFGPALGTAVVSVASTAGASAAFLVGRYLARPAVERRIAQNARFAAVDAAIAAQGPKIVFLLRLSPLFPYSLLNYALSLTSVEFGPYVAASWAGMLPGTVAFVALGGAGKAAAETAAGGGTDPLKLGLYAVGAAATLWATSIISKAASRALEEASGEGEPLSKD